MEPLFSRLDISGNFQILHPREKCPVAPVFHYHEINEIYLCLTPTMRYLAGPHLYDLKYGDLLMFSSMDIHRPFPPQSGYYERWMLLFRSEYIEPLSSPDTDLLSLFTSRPPDFNHRLRLTGTDLEELLRLLRRIERNETVKEYGNDVRRRILLAEVLLFLQKLHRSRPDEGRNAAPPRIAAVLRFIHARFQEPIDLKRLSVEFGLNRNYLNTLFREHTGFTLNQYLIHYRILHAKTFLRQGYSVTDAAFECGFSNLSHFIRTFGRIAGRTPGEYRRDPGRRNG